MFKIDSAGATIDNQFTEGNPQTGIPATVVSAQWLNAVMFELVNILIARGITLDKTKNNQVSEFLQRGIDTWYSTLIYKQNSVCLVNGKIYISQIDSNINHNPATDDGTNWKSSLNFGDLSITNTTDAASIITGALKVAGGLGVAKNIYSGTGFYGDLNGNVNTDLIKPKTSSGNIIVKNSNNMALASFANDALVKLLGDCRLVQENGGSCPAGGTLDFYIGRYMLGLIVLISSWGGAVQNDMKIYAISGHSCGSQIVLLATLQSGNINSLSYQGYTDPYLGRRYAQKFRCTCSATTGASVYYKALLPGDGDDVLQPIN